MSEELTTFPKFKISNVTRSVFWVLLSQQQRANLLNHMSNGHEQHAVNLIHRHLQGDDECFSSRHPHVRKLLTQARMVDTNNLAVPV